MAKKTAAPDGAGNGVKQGVAAKRSKPKEKNAPRKAAQFFVYASEFGDWAEKTRRQMKLAAERLERFDENHEVVLITSMIDKLMQRISTRVKNQFGDDPDDKSKLSKDIRKERGERAYEAINGKRRPRSPKRPTSD